MVSRKIYTAYAADTDMTFIMEESSTDNGHGIVTKTRVAGFYYGEPQERLTEKYFNDLEAETFELY